MSEIAERLRNAEPVEMLISDNDRIALIELLSFVAMILDSGKIWINSKDADQRPYIELCERHAKKLANLKVENLQ